LANPCFDIDIQKQQQKMRIMLTKCARKKQPLAIAAENPIFDKLMSNDFHAILEKNGMGESGGSSSSGFSSASNSRLCSTESIYSSSFSSTMNDSFSSSSNDEFGGGPTSTRNCLADSEGDELVRFGTSGNHPISMDKIIEKEKEESNQSNVGKKKCSKRSLVDCSREERKFNWGRLVIKLKQNIK